jgi:hypothetical protein
VTHEGDHQIEPVFRWLMDNDPAGALEYVAALKTYFVRTGGAAAGRRLTEEAVSAFITLGSSDYRAAATISPALLAAAELAFIERDREAAHTRAHDCIRAAILVNDRDTAALAHVVLARIARRDGDQVELAKHSHKAAELAPRLNVPDLIAADEDPL